MKNYKQTASDVLRLVGGEKNVVQVEHCSTRLRFTLADTSKVDAAALKKTAGVMGVISSGPQCQVVIGNDVIEVYDELLKLGTFNAGQAAAPAAPKGKKEIGGIILDYMVGIFQPLVPAIAGAGVLKALMVLLSTLGLMSSGDIAYKVFVGVADDKVCFTVYGNEHFEPGDWAPYVQSTVVFGRCHLIDDAAATEARVRELGMKYYPGKKEVEKEIALDIKAVQLYEITIEHLTGKQIHEK